MHDADNGKGYASIGGRGSIETLDTFSHAVNLKLLLKFLILIKKKKASALRENSGNLRLGPIKESIYTFTLTLHTSHQN